MYTPGLDDEVLMIVPYVLVPLQLYFISSITKQTPFIVRQSLKLFVRKYVLYVTFLMSMQCMQAIIMVFGSKDPHYFNYEGPDGFKMLRYGYIILDHLTFNCLIACTILEPVFIRRVIRLKNRLLCRKHLDRKSRRFTSILEKDPLPTLRPKRNFAGMLQS